MENDMNLTAPPPTPTGSFDDDVLVRVVTIAPTPLLPGEKETDYETIATNIVVASEPQDAIEEYLVRDVIDLTWETLRFRRLKAGILRASMGAGVGAILDDVGFPYDERGALAEQWAAGDKSARKKVDAVLIKAGLTIDDVTAKTLSSQMDDFERIDRMLSSVEARRNNALREIDRHREAAGAAVRRAIDEVEDAEFRDVDTGEIIKAPAS
jgi:hypothetical protein